VDETDRRLLQALRENARAPVAALAAKLGLARGTVQARLDRLIASGVIQGFTIRTRADEGNLAVRAITLVEVSGGRQSTVMRALRAFPEITEVHSTNGRWDLVLEISSESLARFDDVLRRVRLIEGVANSETSLLLS
jgi:DNA-binding Lrp family transcriptional regulator